MAKTKQGTQKRDINAGMRVELALALRAQRIGYEEIAQRCGYGNPGTAYNAVMRELDRRVVKNVDEMRREELAMLDMLHAKIWPIAIGQPDAPLPVEDENAPKKPGRKHNPREPHLFAVDRILAISEARRKLLGVDLKNEDAAIAGMVLIRQVAADTEAI